MKGFVVGVLIGAAAVCRRPLLLFRFRNGTCRSRGPTDAHGEERWRAARSTRISIRPMFRRRRSSRAKIIMWRPRNYKDQCAGCHGLPDQNSARDRGQYVSRRDADVQGQGRDRRSSAGKLLEGKERNPVDRNADALRAYWTIRKCGKWRFWLPTRIRLPDSAKKLLAA